MLVEGAQQVWQEHHLSITKVRNFWLRLTTITTTNQAQNWAVTTFGQIILLDHCRGRENARSGIFMIFYRTCDGVELRVPECDGTLSTNSATILLQIVPSLLIMPHYESSQ
jgi:hypothetical protein